MLNKIARGIEVAALLAQPIDYNGKPDRDEA